MRKLKVHYFDFEKYEDDWKQYLKTNQVRWLGNKMLRNPFLSPNDKGYSPYIKEVEIETEKFIRHEINQQSLVFDYIVEIDNDFLYHDELGNYTSHINNFRVLNEYYTKYNNTSNLIDFKSGFIGQIERELKLRTIIND